MTREYFLLADLIFLEVVTLGQFEELQRLPLVDFRLVFEKVCHVIYFTKLTFQLGAVRLKHIQLVVDNFFELLMRIVRQFDDSISRILGLLYYNLPVLLYHAKLCSEILHALL